MKRVEVCVMRRVEEDQRSRAPKALTSLRGAELTWVQCHSSERVEGSVVGSPQSSHAPSCSLAEEAPIQW